MTEILIPGQGYTPDPALLIDQTPQKKKQQKKPSPHQETESKIIHIEEKRSPARLDEIKSGHQSRLPSMNVERAYNQAAGRAITQKAIWEDKDTLEDFIMHTPNGADIEVAGNSQAERLALKYYTDKVAGAFSIKLKLTLFNLFHQETQGKKTRKKVLTNIRNILLSMGYSSADASRRQEQAKCAYALFFYARAKVTVDESEEQTVIGPRGGIISKGKKINRIEYSPLIELSGIQAKEDGSMDVAGEIEFRITTKFQAFLYGEKVQQQFYYLPSLIILKYHSLREQDEICIALYLINMFFVNKGGQYPRSFCGIATNAAVMTKAEIKSDNQRIRTAERVVYAIDRVEKDGLVKRSRHEQMDLIIAIDLILENVKEEKIAPATLERITSYNYLKQVDPQKLLLIRREAFQELMKSDSKTMQFKPGVVTKKRVQSRVEGQEKAIETQKHQAEKMLEWRAKRGNTKNA